MANTCNMRCQLGQFIFLVTFTDDICGGKTIAPEVFLYRSVSVTTTMETLLFRNTMTTRILHYVCNKYYIPSMMIKDYIHVYVYHLSLLCSHKYNTCSAYYIEYVCIYTYIELSITIIIMIID